MATGIKDNVYLIDTTNRDDAVLVAWLGDLDTPVAYWPTDDEDAFRRALRVWAERENLICEGSSESHTDVDAFMGAIEINVHRESPGARPTPGNSRPLGRHSRESKWSPSSISPESDRSPSPPPSPTSRSTSPPSSALE